jgi:hypothetical protein
MPGGRDRDRTCDFCRVKANRLPWWPAELLRQGCSPSLSADPEWPLLSTTYRSTVAPVWPNPRSYFSTTWRRLCLPHRFRVHPVLDVLKLGQLDFHFGGNAGGGEQGGRRCRPARRKARRAMLATALPGGGSPRPARPPPRATRRPAEPRTGRGSPSLPQAEATSAGPGRCPSPPNLQEARCGPNPARGITASRLTSG